MRYLLLITLLGLVAACSSKKIKVSAIEPAEAEGAASIRTIAFLPFTNDHIGIGGVIEGAVGSYTLEPGKPYFKIVERRNLNSILAEQELSASWTVDPEQRVRVGKMTGAEGFLTGGIVNASSSSSQHGSSRSRCAAQNSKGHCTKYESYTVQCTETKFVLSVLVKLINTSTGTHSYSNTFTEQKSYSKCPDYGSIPSSGEVMAELANSISKSLLAKIAPTKYELEVKLIEKLSDVDDPTDAQEQLFESGLEFAKVGRTDKAQEFFKRLGESVNWKSYVVNYNYAVMLEAVSNLTEAEKHYKAADSLVTKPVEEVNEGMQRIATRIQKQAKLEQQLKERE